LRYSAARSAGSIGSIQPRASRDHLFSLVGASSKRRAWAGENFVKQQISGWRRLLAK
jgi:hypothetical protein